jgi:hypothetical protein
MKRILSEKDLVVVLFVLVLITFAMAQEDTKKMERAYPGVHSSASAAMVSSQPSAVATLSAFKK